MEWRSSMIVQPYSKVLDCILFLKIDFLSKLPGDVKLLDKNCGFQDVAFDTPKTTTMCLWWARRRSGDEDVYVWWLRFYRKDETNMRRFFSLCFWNRWNANIWSFLYLMSDGLLPVLLSLVEISMDTFNDRRSACTIRRKLCMWIWLAGCMWIAFF